MFECTIYLTNEVRLIYVFKGNIFDIYKMRFRKKMQKGTKY